MKSTLKATTWFADGKPAMPAQKRAEVVAFYQKFNDRNIEVTYRVLPRRSIQSNKYYWVVVLPMMVEAMNEYGNDFDVDSMHEWCKERFNGVDVIGPGGEVVGRKGSTTTDLNNEEFFNHYIESIRRFAAEELFITIPDPGQQSVMFAEFDSSVNVTIISNG